MVQGTQRQILYLQQAIAAQESLRDSLGDEVVDTALAALRKELASLDTRPATRSAQRKLVTILFADVVASTMMFQHQDPEDVLEIMHGALRAFVEAIKRYDGMVARLMGDGLLAFFGAPVGREDDPMRAVRAGLAILEAAQAYARRVEGEWGISDFAVRVGINTGVVALGGVGSANFAEEYTAMGDAVNIASRLESAAPVGSLLISHDTYRHIRGIFDVHQLEPLRVKGKPEPIQAYLVMGEKPRAFRLPTRGVEGVETRMIGREAEMRRLQAAVYSVIEERRATVVTVVGDAGVGKSRLLYEFSNWLDLLPEQLILMKGRCDEGMSHLPYALIRDLFAFRFDIHDNDKSLLAREKLEQGIVQFIGEEGLERAHFLGHLLGFDYSDSPYLRGVLHDARQIRDRAFHYARSFFAAITTVTPALQPAHIQLELTATRQPVILFLEDVHWADSDSLDFVEYLVRECQDIPLLIVCLARQSLFEQRPNWGSGTASEQYIRLPLTPLTEEESSELVVEILQKVPEVPDQLKDLIVDGAEGNPFYVEELIKVLIEDGVIVAPDGADQWRVEPQSLAELRVPQTLTEVLQARLDGLPPLERETLQRAAIVGRVFWASAVERLRGDKLFAKRITRETLNSLQEKELIFSNEASAFEGEREYVFKHALFRDVAYESVLKQVRRLYHAQVAAWLIERSGERVDEYADVIAEHYERAGESLMAIEWYGKAARQAQDTDAPSAAIEYYHKALQFLPTGPEHAARRAIMNEGLGEMLQRQAHYVEAMEAYKAMIAAAEMIGDEAAQARAWCGLAEVCYTQGNHEAVLEHTSRAEELTRAIDAKAELATTLSIRCRALYELGDHERALEQAEEALAVSRELAEPGQMAYSLANLGLLLLLLEHYVHAAQYTQYALDLYREVGNLAGEASMIERLGACASFRGDYAEAEKYFEESLTVAREIGHPYLELLCLSSLCGVRVKMGDYHSVVQDLQYVTSQPQILQWFFASEAFAFLSEAYLGQDRLDEALVAVKRALDLALARKQQVYIGRAWRLLGRILARKGRPVRLNGNTYDATTCFAESMWVFTEANLDSDRARTFRAWALFDFDHGRAETGENMWQKAKEIFVRLGMKQEVARMTREFAN
jgi:predicted ATPase/class 3 adenylate cyclase